MNLELPQRKKPGNLSFNTDPAALTKWLNDLPLINTGKSLELIDSALEQINTLSIPTQNRQQALELFTPAVMVVTDALKKKFLGKQLPLKNNNLLCATQALELCNKMAIGYRILAEDLNATATKQPQLALALHCALRYLSEILLTNYRIYIQYPAGLWKTINTLYAVADANNLAQQPVTDSTLKEPLPSTIETTYKQILLLSLACPYRLRQGEIHLAYNTLINWAGASQLYRVDEKDTHGLFCVNLQSDNPPSYRALDNGNSADTRILDTRDMSGQLRESLTNNKASDIDTLQRLLLAWGDMPKRQFARHPQNASVKLVIGLNTIHQLALKPAPEKSKIDDNIHDKHYLQDPTFENATSITTGTTYGQSFKQRVAPDANPLKGAYATDASNSTQIESWKIADISAGGYCLLWDSDEVSCAKIGELVALIEKDHIDPDKWQLGTIRRMKFTEQIGLELGIQLLSPGARAIWARPCREGVNTGDKMQGILLPEIKAIKIEASLLLPSLLFRTGSMATIEDGDQTTTVSLTRQLENTGRFSQYHFTAV
jgi:hypothetical protein